MELLNAAFSMINLPFTVLLIIILLYWLSVIAGILDISSFDFDLDADVDADVDVDVAGGGIFQALLAFVNLGELPFMLVLSVFVVSLWTIAILANYFLGNTSGLMALVLAAPNLVISVFITKIFTKPFAVFYRKLDDDPADKIKTVGSLCTLLADADELRISQGEVKTNGAPLLVTVRTRPGVSMTKGSTGLIVEKDPNKDIYIVEPFDDWES